MCYNCTGTGHTANEENITHLFVKRKKVRSILQSTTDQLAKVCNLDILGVANAKSENVLTHEEFLDQLTRNEDGHYETRLHWKESQVLVPIYRNLSKARLGGTVKNSEHMEKLKEYAESCMNRSKKETLSLCRKILRGRNFILYPTRW